MSVATIILAFGVLVVAAHATNVSQRDAVRVRRVAAALPSLGARPTALDERAATRRLAGCYWLALGHDLAVWNAVECTTARGNLIVFSATVDAGFGLSKHRRRWAVACFSTARDVGHVLALREALLPVDGHEDYHPDAESPAIHVRAPHRHSSATLTAVRAAFAANGDTSIELRGHLVVLWRPLRHVVNDCVALAQTAAALHESLERAARPAQGDDA